MKKNILKIMCFIFFISNISYAQFFADSVISDAVIELFKIADNEKKDNLPNDNSNVEDDSTIIDIDRIAQLFYRVFDEDPVGYNIYLKQKFQKWSAVRDLNELKPAIKIRRLTERVAQKYGIPFTEIIKTPAFLRCKFLFFSSSYYTEGIISSDFNFIVEDVLKGNKYFKVGDTITVRMLPDIECPSPEFKVGNSYIVSLGTNFSTGQDSFNIIFHYLVENYNTWIMGKPPTTFLIEKEIIQKCEYFGFSEMEWNKFKEFFKEKYLIFN